jgi:hypothetical protein
MPSFAFAHGEEAVVLLLAEVVIVVGCMAASFLLLRAHHRAWLGILACLVAVAVAWGITLDLPFRDNEALITSLHLVLPVVMTAAAVIIARRFSAPAPNSAFERTREEQRAAQRER